MKLDQRTFSERFIPGNLLELILNGVENGKPCTTNNSLEGLRTVGYVVDIGESQLVVTPGWNGVTNAPDPNYTPQSVPYDNIRGYKRLD